MTNGPTLLAFDFDGTLAPIHDEPGRVRMHRAAGVLLRHAAAIEGVVVALVSGRDADDLAARAETGNIYVVGSHGLEIRGPGGVLLRDSAPIAAHPDPPMCEAFAAAGLRLEKKRHAIALHWRGLDPALAAPAAGRFRHWARRSGLEVIEGRCVVEARCSGGDKGGALRWLTEATGAWRIIYAGDDLTDFPALRFAAGRGRGIFVSSSERTPPPGVTVVSTFRQLFRIVRDEVGM